MFIQRGGTISSIITASCRTDLPQGGLEIPCLLKFEREEKYVTKVKLVQYALPTMTTMASEDSDRPPMKKVKYEDIADGESRSTTITSATVATSDKTIKAICCPETETIVCGRKLSDLHINFAQHLLKAQFPRFDGLQSTLYQCRPVQQVREQDQEMIQVIHSREDHWIIASTVGSRDGVVYVYDSLLTRQQKISSPTSLERLLRRWPTPRNKAEV